MCKLTQNQYHLCNQCKNDIKELFRNNKDPAVVLDLLLEKYDKTIIEFVLAATIKSHSIIKGEFSPQTVEWAKPKYNIVGFLSENIKIKNASKFAVESLCELSRRR